MESSALTPLSQITCFSPKPGRSRSFAFPSRLWKQRTTRTTRLHCHKMFVPGFGEASPEAQAATNLHNFFTYIAVKIVAAQLQSYNPEAYEELMEFLERNPLNDGNKFCANLMRESSRHQSLALRILEVRSAYCKNDFEWDNMRRLAYKMVNDSNTKLMRDYVLETSHDVDIAMDVKLSRVDTGTAGDFNLRQAYFQLCHKYKREKIDLFCSLAESRDTKIGVRMLDKTEI